MCVCVCERDIEEWKPLVHTVQDADIMHWESRTQRPDSSTGWTSQGPPRGPNVQQSLCAWQVGLCVWSWCQRDNKNVPSPRVDGGGSVFEASEHSAVSVLQVQRWEKYLTGNKRAPGRNRYLKTIVADSRAGKVVNCSTSRGGIYTKLTWHGEERWHRDTWGKVCSKDWFLRASQQQVHRLNHGPR